MDGTVVCWGLNNYRQTNTPLGLTNVVTIAAGLYHTLALREDGTLVAWGAGTNTYVSNPHYGQSMVPLDVSNVVAIAAGDYHSLALRRDGTIRVWGAGTVTNFAPNYGQAIMPPGLTNVIALAGGSYSSLVLIGEPVFASPAAVPHLASGVFRLPIATLSGRAYELESRDDLATGNWRAAPLVPGGGAVQDMTDLSATNSQRFYRVRQW